MKLTRQQRRKQEARERKQNRSSATEKKRSREPGSTRPRPGASRSRTQPAGDFSLIERFDNFSALRNGLRHIAGERSDWAGIPMPLEGHKLVINPKFPMALELSLIGAPEPTPVPEGVKLRNSWWSNKHRCMVYVWEEPDGRILAGKVPPTSQLTMQLTTMFCSSAWGIEQEAKALQLLGTLVKHHQFKSYMLTGMFLESSPRSGLTYLFRRLRPTVVLDARSGRESDKTRILCALCLHPIAYYAETWAGAMTPTDDLIAHLMLMRGDEPMFWRRANQHPPGRPEAAI